jgi:hypothetical protein
MDRNKKSSMNYYSMDPNMKQGMMPMQMNYPPMYGNPMNYPGHYMPYYQPPPQGYFYDPNYYKAPEEGEMYPDPIEQQNSEEINHNIH